MTNDLWDQAVAAVAQATSERDYRTRNGFMQPPHCVLMRNRYSGRLVETFYFDYFDEAKTFMRLLRRAGYAGTRQTDYGLSYQSDY